MSEWQGKATYGEAWLRRPACGMMDGAVFSLSVPLRMGTLEPVSLLIEVVAK